MEVMEFMVILLAFILFWLSIKYYDYSLKNRLYEHVAWCAGGDSIEYSRPLSLLSILCNAQIEHKLSKEYCLIEESERNTAKEILRFFQEYLTQAYFKGTLSSSRSVVQKSSEAYFISTLKWYLEKYQCDTDFHGNKMYTTKNYKAYGSWGVPLFDATYILTDYAIVYHKLLYIVDICFLDIFKDKLQQDSVAHRNTEYTKKVLDTKEIEVSRY